MHIFMHSFWPYLQEQQGEIPSFLQSWLLYLSSLCHTELPNYTILLKILLNSKASWTDFHPATSPNSQTSSIQETPVIHKKQRLHSAIFAPEE